MKIFLSGGTIYSFDDSQRSISKGYLGIDDEQILFISAEKPKDFTADRIVNCKECLILPGFVNCHTHLAENLFKGLMDEVDFEGLFYSTLFSWESQLDPEMVYWGSLAGALDRKYLVFHLILLPTKQGMESTTTSIFWIFLNSWNRLSYLHSNGKGFLTGLLQPQLRPMLQIPLIERCLPK